MDPHFARGTAEGMSSSEGFIDVHSHLLPGIDDGCALIADSLDCIRLLKEAGFAGSICTPHFLPSIYPENTPEFIRERAAALQQEVDDAGLDYRLWAGAEVRLDAETTQWLDRHGVPTLAGSRYVLIDYFGKVWPEFADETIAWLIDRGYRPILGHPERLGLDPDDLLELIDRLTAAGVLLQGNLACFAAAEGLQAAAMAGDWLLGRKYFCLATDVHRPAHWPHRLAGLGEVRELNSKLLAKLLGETPREIVETSS
jgi:protein-tyrosine phosphatase